MKLHKRILSVLLAGVMLSGLALTACNKSGGGKGGAGSSHREVKNVEPKGQVIMGTTTEPSGDWTWGAFSANNATDSDVVFLTDDLGTVSTDEGGSYVINNTVVESYERTEDADGNATYTFKIKEGLKFNNGEPIKAENYLAWTMFIISPAGQEYGATSVGYNSIPGGLDYKDGKVNYLAGARLLGEYECSVTTLKTGYDGNENLPYYYDLGLASLRCVNLPYWFGEGWTVKDDGQGAYFYNENGKEFTLDNIKASVEAARFAKGNRVTCGAYNLVNYDEAAKQITLEVNPNYPGDFNGQKPGIQKIVIVKAEQETAVDTLKTGGFELYSGITDGSEVNQIVDLISSGELVANYCRYDRAGFGYFCFACDFRKTQYTRRYRTENDTGQ